MMQASDAKNGLSGKSLCDSIFGFYLGYVDNSV